ncbi:MAG: DUF309 domain-containing protein [Desulforhopalus sp.]
MTEQLFNPFEDRLSRDIRNDLSEGLAEAVESSDDTKLQETIARYRNCHLSECYSDYVEERYKCYKQALTTITGKIDDPIHQALVLWDYGLFFEVHEVLEHLWYSAEGQMKLTLQALIRAAGVYIKKEYGFHDSALRISGKAIPVLEENHTLLAPYFPVDTLIAALKSGTPPPKLLATNHTP